MKVVAVSQRVDAVPERGETRDALDQRLVEFLLGAGYLPAPVPNALVEGAERARGVDRVCAWLGAISAKAIVLSGGNDIGQFPARDRTEGALLDYARDRGLPALGICRGMQMMAYWAGVKLRPVTGHVRSRHRLRGEIVADVNSYHNFSLASAPDGFKVLARSEDDEIEAIRHTVLPWEGWMWHPEREPQFSTNDVERVKALFGV